MIVAVKYTLVTLPHMSITSGNLCAFFSCCHVHGGQYPVGCEHGTNGGFSHSHGDYSPCGAADGDHWQQRISQCFCGLVSAQTGANYHGLFAAPYHLSALWRRSPYAFRCHDLPERCKIAAHTAGGGGCDQDHEIQRRKRFCPRRLDHNGYYEKISAGIHVGTAAKHQTYRHVAEAQKAGDYMAEKFLIKKKAEIFAKGFQLFYR